MMRRTGLVGLLLAGAMASQLGASQTGASASGDYAAYVARAKAASVGPAKNLLSLCDLGTGQPRRNLDAQGMQTAFPPGKVFDNVYYVGLQGISAWAIDTGDGIILIDALNNAREARDVIVANMQKVGLDPKRLQYLIITHGHGDHYGGAAWLAQQYHPRLIASDRDWSLMEGPPQFANPNWDAPPLRDQSVRDGEQLRLGKTKITFYVTPGHTPGTLSMIFDVTDKGRNHTVAFWGGTAFNFKPTVENFGIYEASAARFRTIVARAKADVILSNHTVYDNSLANLAALATRRPGAPNPYVVGPREVANFFTVAEQCAAARKVAVAAKPAA